VPVIKLFRPAYVLILNPDLLILESQVIKLAEILSNNSDVYLSSPLLINNDGSIQNSVRVFPNLFDFLFRILNFKQINYAEKIFNNINAPFVHGACFLFKYKIFNLIGGFDESFFLYCEDLDICRRIIELDKRIIVVPKIECIHKHNRSSRKVFLLFLVHLKSIFIYYKKWGLVHNNKIKIYNTIFINSLK